MMGTHKQLRGSENWYTQAPHQLGVVARGRQAHARAVQHRCWGWQVKKKVQRDGMGGGGEGRGVVQATSPRVTGSQHRRRWPLCKAPTPGPSPALQTCHHTTHFRGQRTPHKASCQGWRSMHPLRRSHWAVVLRSVLEYPSRWSASSNTMASAADLAPTGNCVAARSAWKQPRVWRYVQRLDTGRRPQRPPPQALGTRRLKQSMVALVCGPLPKGSSLPFLSNRAWPRPMAIGPSLRCASKPSALTTTRCT
jgi:hypothetical protein